MKAWRGMLLSVALVGSVITYALAIEPFWIKTSTHTIGHPSVSAPIRVAQLSDLHLQTLDKQAIKVIEEVERLKPDLVVITGDAVDKQKALPALDQFLAALPKGAQTVAILGNWEYWAGIDIEALRAGLSNSRIRRLNGKGLRFALQDIRTLGKSHFSASFCGRHQEAAPIRLGSTTPSFVVSMFRLDLVPRYGPYDLAQDQKSLYSILFSSANLLRPRNDWQCLCAYGSFFCSA
ncbi:MAG: hypothetical protein EBT99_17520 [Betaproteobacteria bacterium]|nr:hypothetical protein [Betaproteobacteria bacterium]